jgi:putative transposase
VWWLRLGITLQRIKPGHLQQNRRHERLHLTLKKEATKPASFNFLQQQTRFDEFVEVYRYQRPHQALNMRYPGELYTPSPRAYRPPDPPQYPFHDRTVRVTQCGRICLGKRKINLSQPFAGQFVGIREVADKIWLVSFPRIRSRLFR